jgi:DNA-directed RNA polymerase subunit RPC12/RpoP
MKKYSYKCRDCDFADSAEFERGKAPKELECPKCSSTLDRLANALVCEVERDFDTFPSETEKLRKNIQTTNDKLHTQQDRTLADSIRKWRHELTKGEY